MTVEDFQRSVAEGERPARLSVPLAALWWVRRGDWEEAHRCVQDDPSEDASWVHAHLHRLEGDEGNAAYWYSRAGRSLPQVETAEEWRLIVAVMLEKQHKN